jgi:hypothetical protein
MQQGRLAFGLASVAVLWAAGFTYWALTASAYSDGSTILETNPDAAARIAIAAPLVVSLVVWAALWLACNLHSAAARMVGLVLATVLALCAMVAGFSIGMFVFPGAALLVGAAGITPVSDCKT